ncbi:hypothetical protein A8709_33070 [Paenibacillus pectinilyticus]|uniref:HTH cro/C1-type domain-containing protein n=1 Tax=Paenibacillus pectinilyticus TaxID=512399 RepID=A0A1C0ZX00_9BACL|nr:helix-turn-helix transcriptional regulator [Paenibacillus pectinilyticus]OCT12644.1 hypothetical protein A8709_33070 [Paenibacillus pectinilyticus]
MIKCNLGVILAERGIKNIQIAEATGINKNTISGLVTNRATGIQYDTLEKICTYLNITAGDLFTIVDFSVNYSEHTKLDDNNYEISIIFKINEEYMECSLPVKIDQGIGRVGEPSFIFDITIPKGLLSKLYAVPQQLIVKELEELIVDNIFDGKYEGVMFETETRLIINHGIINKGAQ